MSKKIKPVERLQSFRGEMHLVVGTTMLEFHLWMHF